MCPCFGEPHPPRGVFKHIWYRDGKRVRAKAVRKLHYRKERYLLWSSIKHTETGSLRLTGEWTVKLFTSGGQILKKRAFLVVK